MPTFSIIVPVYNVETYITKCLESIASQTFSDIEVILVDDGSSDESLSICKLFCAHDPRFRVFSKKNEGQGIARNLGLSFATGEFICFIDSDDWVEPDLCEIAFKALKDNDSDFFNFGVNFLNTEGAEVKRFAKFKFSELNGHEIFYKALIDDQILSIVWNKVFRRSIIVKNEISFPDIRAIEDIYFSRAISKISNKAIFVNDILYHALVRPNSSSRQMTVQSFIDAENLLKLEYTRFIKDHNQKIHNLFGTHVLKFYSYLQIQSAFRVGNYSEYIKCYKAIKSSAFYNSVLKFDSIKNLPLINRLMLLICQFPLSLRLLSKILKLFKITPY